MALAISKTYAKSLLEVAEDQQVLDTVLAEVTTLASVLDDNSTWRILTDVAYSQGQKDQILDLIYQAFSPIVVNLLKTVQHNGRLGLLKSILAEVNYLAETKFKISELVVTSSQALSQAQLDKVERLAKKRFDLVEVKISNQIDPSIIGGFIINARGRIIDASLKTQLAKIASQII